MCTIPKKKTSRHLPALTDNDSIPGFCISRKRYTMFLFGHFFLHMSENANAIAFGEIAPSEKKCIKVYASDRQYVQYVECSMQSTIKKMSRYVVPASCTWAVNIEFPGEK